MPARSRKRRDKNAKIKRERNRVKELKTLKKTLGLIDKDGKSLLMEVEDIVDEKNVESIKAVIIELNLRFIGILPKS